MGSSDVRDCIFCKIVAGEIPGYKVYEDDKFLAVLDIAQFTEGHTIVVPKEHLEVVWDVPYVGEYFEVVQKIGNHYRNIGYKFVDILTFGRMIHHSHVHIVPHNGDDKGWDKALTTICRYQTDPKRHPSSQEGNRIMQKFMLPV